MQSRHALIIAGLLAAGMLSVVAVKTADAQGTEGQNVSAPFLSACYIPTKNPLVFTVRSTAINVTGSEGTHYLSDDSRDLRLEIPAGYTNRLYLDVHVDDKDFVSHGFTGTVGLGEIFVKESITQQIPRCLN